MRWWLFRWWLAGSLVCTLASPAQGELLGGSDEERARELYAQAQAASAEERHEEAIRLLRKAWDLYKDPVTLCDIGSIELSLGRARNAAESFSMCKRLLDEKSKRMVGKRVENELKKARALVGAITVEANVPDADVLVDDKGVGKLPLQDPIFVEPGSHAVEIRAHGYEPFVQMVVLGPGASTLMRTRLEPMRVEVVPPLHEQPLPETKTAPDAKAAPPVMAPPLTRKTSAPTPDRSAEPARAAVLLAGFGLGIAGTAVGVGGLMAASATKEEARLMLREGVPKSDDCTTPTQPCKKLENTINKATTLTAVGVVGIAVAAAGGTLIIYEIVRAAPREGKGSAQATITAAPGGGAITIKGSF
jgi:hypothetical protein